MKFEERGLPPSLRYVNRRLTGQPLVAVIWLIVMISVFASVYMLDSGRGQRGTLIMYSLLCCDLIVMIALISVAIRIEGRTWLLAKYDCGNDEVVSAGSRAIIRLLPLMGFLVLGEYLFLR